MRRSIQSCITLLAVGCACHAQADRDGLASLIPAADSRIPWSNALRSARISPDGAAVGLVGPEFASELEPERLRFRKDVQSDHPAVPSGVAVLMLEPAIKVQAAADIRGTPAARGAWSPDSQRFGEVFGLREPSIGAYERATGDWKQVIEKLQLSLSSNVTWSPDSKQLAVCEFTNRKSKYAKANPAAPLGTLVIHAMEAASDRRVAVTGFPDYPSICGVSWSPSGRYVALVVDNSPGSFGDSQASNTIFLCIIDVAAGAVAWSESQPGVFAGEYHVPQWSSDSGRLVYCAGDGLRDAHVDADGRVTALRSTERFGTVRFAAWFPHNPLQLLVLGQTEGEDESSTAKMAEIYSTWVYDVKLDRADELTGLRVESADAWSGPWCVPRTAEALARWLQ